MEDLVQIAVFLDDGEANIAKAKLESGGVQGLVFVENLGGEGPRRGRLMVQPADVEEACDVLELELPEPIRDSKVGWYLTVFGLVLVGVALLGIVQAVFGGS